MARITKSKVAYTALLTALGGLTLGACQAEQRTDAPTSPAPKAENTARTDGYSPTKNAYFGDLHIHTKNSFDAYIFNVRTTPADVYKFALGENVRHPAGYDIMIAGDPLDFVAATDHGAYMGILPQMDNPDSPLSDLEVAKNMFGTDPTVIIGAFQTVGASVRSGVPLEGAYDRDIIDSTWQSAVATADKYYRPGELTTFAAYEFTAVTSGRGADGFGGGNLHRNVFFADAAPDRLFSTLDSTNPEDLWDWMDEQRAQGRDSIAIPHNSNVSDGEMFAMTQTNGDMIDADYTTQRLRNEPIVEMTQVKGTSETHPELSPNDEFADFEIYDQLLASNIVSKVDGSYVRQALARGLALEEQTGTNPYAFGMIGSSDSHVAGGAFDEKDYWSKVGIVDGTPEARGSVPPGGAKSWEGIERDANAENWFSRWSASGYAVAWAEENTRESIFSAMRNRETYATSGTRIKLRFFGGDMTKDMLDAPDMVARGYSAGVPMGGVISGMDAPSFLAWAARDPRGGLLDRVQIIKAWHTADGPQEAVYDMACSVGAPDPVTHRCADNGADVDLSNCTPSTGAGAAELKAVWTDPNPLPGVAASYYVRVLENPSCRWSTWEALRAGVERHPDRPATIKERAYSSPIWTRSN
jgi:hypothetical protein